MSTANRTGHAGRPPSGTDERKPWVNPSTLANPATLPPNTVRDVAYSPEGALAIVVGDTGTANPGTAADYVKVYERRGDALVYLADLPSLPVGSYDSVPSGVAYGATWHPDGDHLAVGLHLTPFVHIYSRTRGTTFTKLANPATLPAEQVQQPAYSPNGQFLACAHATSPFVTIYSRSGDTYTKLSDPALLPTGTGISCAWSPDSQFLAVAHVTTPFVTIYQRSGTTFTKLTNPGTLPASTGTGAAFSPDGRFLAVGHVTTPFLTVYRIDGTTFTKLADPANLPPSNVRELSWGGPDGRHLFCSSDATPFHVIYRRDSDTLVKLSNLPATPNDIAYAARPTPDGRFLAVAVSRQSGVPNSATPYLLLFKTGG